MCFREGFIIKCCSVQDYQLPNSVFDRTVTPAEGFLFIIVYSCVTGYSCGGLNNSADVWSIDLLFLRKALFFIYELGRGLCLRQADKRPTAERLRLQRADNSIMLSICGSAPGIACGKLIRSSKLLEVKPAAGR